MADIPGIIEGAAEGKGLGLRFLRHIERNSILLFMIPAEEVDIQQKYEILLNELKKYNPSLLEKSKILAISKSDMLDDELKEAMKKNLPTDVPAVFISSLTGEGIPELKDLIWSELNKPSNQIIEISHAPIPVSNQENEEELEEDFFPDNVSFDKPETDDYGKMDWDDWNE